MNEDQLKELAVDDEAAKKLIDTIERVRQEAKNKAAEESKASIEKLSKQIEQEKQAAREAIQNANNILVSRELEDAIKSKNAIDVGAVLALCDRSKIVINEDNTVDVSAVIAEVEEKYAALFVKEDQQKSYAVRKVETATSSRSDALPQKSGLSPQALEAIEKAKKERNNNLVTIEDIRKYATK